MTKLTVTAQQRVWIEIGLIFLVSVLALRFLCLPLLGRLSTLRVRAQEVAAQLAEGEAMAQHTSAHEAVLAQAQQRYATLSQRVGAETSLARVLETFRRQAQDHRVELMTMQPRASADAAPGAVALGEGLTLREVPLTLQLTGRYRHLGEFFAGLDEEPFTVVVRSLKMSHVEGSRTQLRAELLLTVYLPEMSSDSSAKAMTVPLMASEALAARETQRQRATKLAWEREPFVSGSLSGEASGLELSGILWDPAQPMAIINGQMVHPGEECEGYRVVEITPETVTLTDGTETFHLTTLR